VYLFDINPLKSSTSSPLCFIGYFAVNSTAADVEEEENDLQLDLSAFDNDESAPFSGRLPLSTAVTGRSSPAAHFHSPRSAASTARNRYGSISRCQNGHYKLYRKPYYLNNRSCLLNQWLRRCVFSRAVNDFTFY